METGQLLLGFSAFLDTATFDTMHQRRVAYIATKIAKRMNISRKVIGILLQAALLHDIALLKEEEKSENFRKIAKKNQENIPPHALAGYRMARYLNLHLEAAEAIELHHTPADKNRSFMGSLIFLSDSIEILFRALTDPFAFGEVVPLLKKRRELFDPYMLDAFKSLAKQEAFWYGMLPEYLDGEMKKIVSEYLKESAPPELIKRIAYLIGFRIDSLTPFLSGYSLLVRNIAISIGYKLSLDISALSLASLVAHAGYAKLPVELLSKPGKLADAEVNIIRFHPYCTKNMLEAMGFDGRIVEMAAYHHLQDGYPFDIKNADPYIETISAATTAAALLQKRPYRPYRREYTIKEAKKLLLEMGFASPIKEAINSLNFDNIMRAKDEYYDGVRRLFL